MDAVQRMTLLPEDSVALNSRPTVSVGFRASVRTNSASQKQAVSPEVLVAPKGPWHGNKALRVSVLSPCLKEGFLALGEVGADGASSVKVVHGAEALAVCSVFLAVQLLLSSWD